MSLPMTVAEILELGDEIDTMIEDGAEDGIIRERIEAMGIAVTDKLDAMWYLIRKHRAAEEQAKEDKRFCEARAKKAAKAQQDIRELVKTMLVGYASATGTAKVSAKTVTASIRIDHAMVAPERVEDWPDDLVVHRTVKDPTEARRRLKQGATIEGFALVERAGIVLRGG